VTHRLRRRWPWILLLAGPVLAGCQRSQGQSGPPPAPPPPEVLVSLPVSGKVTDYEDFPGRTEAVFSVDVRARVTGYLDTVHFKEGADVKKGDLLFEIDPRPYKAELARADGNVIQSEGHLRRLNSDMDRARRLLPQGAMGREDFDKVAGDQTEAVGALAVAKAARDMADLNLNWTKVRAPISGRISRRNIDPGNLVKADDTVLTSIVSLDPIYAYFDVDERTTLRLQELIRKRTIKWSADGGIPVQLGLASEKGFPHEGRINFADNRVDPDTGTWRLRGLFANADHALAPGLFVRIRLPIGGAYTATLIAEQALSTDQGQKFVYVIDESGKAVYRRVTVGRVHDGLRVITSGLAPGEKIAVSGLQFIQPGSEVQSKLVKMPLVFDTETGAGPNRKGPEVVGPGADKTSKTPPAGRRP
jgi:RND family efflux transporter MFP subunit